MEMLPELGRTPLQWGAGDGAAGSRLTPRGPLGQRARPPVHRLRRRTRRTLAESRGLTWADVHLPGSSLGAAGYWLSYVDTLFRGKGTFEPFWPALTNLMCFAFLRGVIEARFVYVFVLGILFTGTKDLLKSQVTAAASATRTGGLWEIHSGLVLLAALLSRPHNLPVLVFSLLIQAILTKFIWRPLRHGAAEVTAMHYWFGQAFFYFQVGFQYCPGCKRLTFNVTYLLVFLRRNFTVVGSYGVRSVVSMERCVPHAVTQRVT